MRSSVTLLERVCDGYSCLKAVQDKNLDGIYSRWWRFLRTIGGYCTIMVTKSLIYPCTINDSGRGPTQGVECLAQ